MTKNVLVALSGGIDSSIAAWKLLEAGYQVKGIHIRLWKWKENDGEYAIDFQLVRKVTDKLGIELLEIDARDRFVRTIIDQMFCDLKDGLTPNPCIRCNPMIKFALLSEMANKINCDHISTGHYVILRQKNDKNYALYKADDTSKDQSYFLCGLNQDILRKCVFPLGTTYKRDNVQLAKEIGVFAAEKPESQDLCFLPGNVYSNFIQTKQPDMMQTGNIISTSGEVIGTHNGLPNYTIGQRKGIRIASEEPYYVIKKDVGKNELIVGRKYELRFNRMVLTNINWISGIAANHFKCNVKIRYRSPEYPCEIKKINATDYQVVLESKVSGITPGQFSVFYKDNEMLGGGMIHSTGFEDV